MAFFNFRRWLRSRSQVKTYRKNPKFMPRFEALEDRTLMSTLPAAVVGNATTILVTGPQKASLSGFSPDVIQDPTNPMNLVEVHANNVAAVINNNSQMTIGASYSTDGGATWTGFLNTDLGHTPPADAFANISDPNLATSGNRANPPPFAIVTNPTAAWDRGENVYITYIERSADNSSGALMFQRFTFSPSSGMTQLTKNKVLERWFQTDPILNPVVAVDNNLASFTDTTVSPNKTQTDTMATLIPDPNNPGVMMDKALYVAWNTNHTAPTGNFTIGNFNANVIKVVGSSDGGANFTEPEFVNNDGNVGALNLGLSHYAAPQVVFTQGSADGRVAGGQLAFVWNDFGNTQTILDSSQPDLGVATNKAADSYIFNPNNAFGVSSATVSNGGSNYVVGDIVMLTGGVFTTPAEFTVTSVNAVSGAITGLSVFQGGDYGVTPFGASPVTNVSGSGTGAGATVFANFVQVQYVSLANVDVNFPGNGYAVGDNLYVAGGTLVQQTPTPSQAQVQVTALNLGATAAALVAGGGGYKLGDVLNVTGGIGALPAQITVNSVGAGGAILTFILSAPGSYTTPPANPVSTTDISTAGAVGAKFTLSFQTAVKAAVASRGSGYVVGDVLTVNGGAFNPTPTQLTVTDVDGTGAILAVSISQGGGYTQQPPNNVNVTDVTTPAASGATFTLTFGFRGSISNFTLVNPGSYTVLPANPNTVVEEVTAATVAAGGSLYKVGDILVVQGGNGTPAQLKVTTVTGGAITGVSIVQVGQYNAVPPSMPVLVTDVTTPAASGALFNLTYSGSGTAAEFDLTFASATGTGPINDAITNPGGGADIPAVNRFTVPVNITDPNFTVGDLEVAVDITHPHLNSLRLDLVSPSGIDIPLLLNSVNGAGQAIPNQGVADQANLGVVNVDRNAGFNSLIGTVFDQNAPRPINDGSASAPYVGRYRPEGTSNGFGGLLSFNGDVGGSRDLTGNWVLKVTDLRSDGTNPGPYQLVDNWSLHFTGTAGNITNRLGTDQTLKTFAPIAGAPSASTPYALANTGPYGPAGVGPDMSVAIDNTLGAFSPYQGRVYVAYTAGGGTNTNVFLASIDNLTTAGSFANTPVKVNDDSVQDNFSEGNRPQFMPTVAVDDVTGTVGVMYYDGRWDPSVYNSQSRVANSFSDSIDGGKTFSPSTTLNTEKTGFNGITGAVINIEPIPGNQSQSGNQFGFGDRQGLVMNAGRVVPVFSSNDNAAGLAIKTDTVTIAAGPRIISGDMGSIVNDFTTLGATYNNTFAADGTRQFNGFAITFDRPIDITTFTPSQVALIYRDTVTPVSLPGVTIPTSDYTVTPLDAGGPFGLLPRFSASANALATTFLVKLKPGKERSGVGTYSYSIGNLSGAPVIRDRLESMKTSAVTPVGSPVTQSSVDVGPNKAITDNTTTNSILNFNTVPAGDVLASVTVSVKIDNYPFTGDLRLTLISPTGTRVLLFNQEPIPFGGFSNGLGPITFDDLAAQPVGNGSPPYSGTFRPESTLSLLSGGVGNGTWTLEIADLFPGTPGTDNGTLASWSLTIQPGTVSTLVNPGNFVDENQDAVTGELPGANSTATSVTLPSPNPFLPPYTGGGPALSQQYKLNDILTVKGGTFSQAATIRVTKVDPGPNSPNTVVGIKGAILGAVLVSGGDYQGIPGNPVTVTGGAGSGATFFLGFASGGVGDVFAIPTPVAAPGAPFSGAPFQLPYSQDTLPLIIPGPHLVSTSVAFNPKFNPTSTDNLVLNSTNNGIDVTFDRNIQQSTFTSANIERIVGPVGPITPYTLGPTVTFTGGGGSGAAGIATIVGGFVTAVTMISAGSGYTTVPTVVFNGGGGKFATGTATVTAGKVTAVTVTSGGLGYSSTTLPAGFAIPAGGTLDSPLTINDSLQVNDLSVGVNITHAQLSELTVTLIAPDGTKVLLLPGGVGVGANLTNAVFDDNAPASIAAGVGPYTGVFRPEQSLTGVAVASGGSGYKVGDALTVVGGAFNTPAQLKVSSVTALTGAAALVAGGKGYQVGDMLTVKGGTFATAATLQVLTVNLTGAILTATVISGGTYTVVPVNPVSVTDVNTPAATGATFNLSYGIASVATTQTGSYTVLPFNAVAVTDATTPAAAGATFNLSFGGLNSLNGKNYLGIWTLEIKDNGTTAGTLTGWGLNPVSVTANPQVLATAAIVSGGSGYTVGDYLTIQGGTVTAAAQLQVASVGAGGVIAKVILIQPGLYSVPPTGTVAVAGGTGTGATFTVTFNSDGTANRTFRISMPTQTISGTYSVQFGPDTQANYLADTSLHTATVVNGGSGYSTGDLLTVSGGTFTAPAQFQVNSVTAVAGPLAAAAITSGGTGYKVNDILVVSGGTFTTPATLQVTTTSGGVITGATVVGGGAYTTEPTDPVTVTDTTTPAASGAVFNVPFTMTLELVQPGSYTVNPASPAAVTGGTGSGATIALAFGNQIDTNLNAGVNLLLGGDPINGTLVPNLYLSGTNTTIPADRTTNSVINVPDSFLVEGVTLQLSIQHQNDPDLTATLIAPDGTQVILFSGVGASGSTPHANFTNTTFDDTATVPIQQAQTQPNTGIGAGPFNPQLPLSAFKNHGSQGQWTLQIVSNSSTLIGTLVNWKLTLKNSVPGSGLGEPVADQFNAAFRIFTQDPTNPVSQQSWTAVGPASIHNGATAGRIGGIAIDPSDPSGNTVYVAGASGSIWKSTNFLTTAATGPIYVPLTDLGPGNSLNTGGITVFGRNKDPNQSIIFVSTGEGDTGTPGVGLLRSMDGGRTWRLLDSTVNVDGNGNVLPINDPGRDHKFDGVTSFKVIVDPLIDPATGGVIVYAAMGNGIWRSTDTGGHWTLLQAGFATDVVLSAGSAGSLDSNGNPTSNLQILYGAIEGQGVYYTINAPTSASMSIRNGGQGVPTRRDLDNSPDTAIPVSNPGINPSGANGRIVLAAPAFVTDDPLANTLYEGWLYASVSSTGGAFQGLYETKDFGLNWTAIHLPVVKAVTGVNTKQTATNNDLMQDFSVDGSVKFPQANYDVSLAVDPNNPNIVYFGGTNDANPNLDGSAGGFIRVDATKVQDVYAEVAYDNSNNDGGLTQLATTGGVSVTGPGYGIKTSQPGSAYYDMLRDPKNPFLTPASLQFNGILSFTNTGGDASYGPFDGSDPVNGIGGLDGTDHHRLVVFKDPLTGHTRLIFGDDQGIWTGTDRGDGVGESAIGGSIGAGGSRNGNLQITQFYDGATQPSTLAADIAGALFYGVAQDDGFPVSDNHVLDNGQISWTGGSGEGDASGVKVDQTGSGTAYYYKWPCCGASPLPSDFFSVVFPATGEVSRVTGLLQPGDDPFNNSGQWPFLGGSRFAVNPIDPTTIAMSSQAGRVFLTTGPSLGYGVQWFPIGDPSDLDGRYAPAIAFGAPANSTAPLSNFIYVGTSGGHIFVTTTGGGVGTPWTNLSAGLDGSPVQFIVTNPLRGSNEAYAVTSTGVFWMHDSSVAGATWVNVTGNLFSAGLSRTLFNDPAQALATLKNLTSIQADWRFAIPDSLGAPNGPKHPVLYVGGVGGVYRSLDKGVTWTYFPNETIDGATQQGGYMPSVQVTDLALSLGNINPLNGTAAPAFGRNMLVATTYGRGDFAIRLNDQIVVPGGAPLFAYAISAVAGPHVVGVSGNTDGTGGTDGVMTGIHVVFSGPVDPATFTTAKVNSVTDPFGNLVLVQSITDEAAPNHNLYDIVFATPAPVGFGFYHVSLGPNISDFSGNKMDQNQNFINGEPGLDVYSARFLFQPFTNNAPVITGSAAGFASVNEDQTSAMIVGTTVNSFVTALSPATISDPDLATYQSTTPSTTPPVGIAVTGVDDTNGVWQYSLDGGATWNAFGAVSDSAARLLEANSNGIASMDVIRFLPNIDFNGTATFTFRAWDLTSDLSVYGADGGTADISSPTSVGGSTAYSATTATATITVNFVNDQPSFVASNPAAGNEDSGANTGVPFVTSFNPGGAPDANEMSQSVLQYIVTGVTNPGLFVSGGQPAVDPVTGNLSYTLNPNVSGATDFMVQVQDNGGTAFGGIDTSVAQKFTLTINFVNDQPTFTGSNQSVNEDVIAPQTVTGWATFNPGGAPDPNELGQSILAYTVTNVTTPTLFSAPPTVDNSGNLHYTLKPNVSGTSTFTVTVQDNGGTLNGGIDTSAPQNFTLTVNLVNDQPKFTASNPPSVNVMTVNTPETVTGWVKSFNPGGAPDLNEQTQTVLAYAVSNVTNPALFSTQPTVDNSGNLHYTLAANQHGTTNFTVTVQDNGGTAFGGVDTSLPQTFTLVVTNEFATATALVSSTGSNPAVFGQNVTFKATVSSPGHGTPTGTVTFVFDNGTPHPVTLTGGVATFSSSTLTKGLHHVVASYTDPANIYANSSASLNQSVLYGTTTVLRTLPASPVTNGTSVLLGASVITASNSTGTISGTVDFKDGSTDLTPGGVPVNPSTGKAQLANQFFSAGVHHLSATYSGDSNFIMSVGTTDLVVTSTTSVTIAQTGGRSPTSVYSEKLTYTATVTPSDSKAAAPTGTVSFYNGSTLLTPDSTPTQTPVGTNSTQYTASFSRLPAGTYNITAKYNGTAALQPSTSPAAPTQTVVVDPTTTTVTASPNSTSSFGENVTWTATVADSSGFATTTPNGGTVNFQFDTGTLHAVPLVLGVARFSSANLTVGNHTVKAFYLGVSNQFGASNGALAGGQTVTAAPTSATVVSSANPASFPQNVTFTATVRNQSGGAVPTGGTVTFTIDSATFTVPMTNGTAAYTTTSPLSVGSHSVTATYNGTTNFAASAPSPVLTEVVNLATQTSVAAAPNPANIGDSVTLTATVTHATGSATLTGFVNFYDGSTVLATNRPVSGGKATFTTTFSTSGSHSIVARYTGDSNYGISSGSTTLTIYPPTTKILGVVTAPTNADFETAPFTITGNPEDANGNPSHPPAGSTATLSIISGPQGGHFVSGNLNAALSGNVWTFSNLDLSTAGTYTLQITWDANTNVKSQIITINAGRST